MILSDRMAGPERAAIPALLAVGAVHHHLVRLGNRLSAGLVLESGEPREVHHFATLIGFGVSAINPYLLFDTVDELVADGRVAGIEDPDVAQRNIVKALGKGLLKTISKMGISTIQSYCGAQIFEAVGLERVLVDRHFTGTASRIGGVGHGRAGAGGARPPRARLAGRRSTRCCRSAASTPGAATASTTCGTRRRSRCCSTACARRTARGTARRRATRVRSTTSTRRSSTTTRRAARRCAGC